MFRIRLKFTKEASIKYLGHLDMMKLLERVIRRSALSVAYSQGYCPKMKLSIAWPLSVGMTSLCEYASFTLDRWLSLDKLVPLLNSVAPADFRILEAVHIKNNVSLTELVTKANWQVKMPLSADQELKSLTSENYIINDEKTGQEIDLKKYLVSVDDEMKIFEMKLPAGPKSNFKIQSYFPKVAQITRLELILLSKP